MHPLPRDHPTLPNEDHPEVGLLMLGIATRSVRRRYGSEDGWGGW
jgi:hypothetical protein